MMVDSIPILDFPPSKIYATLFPNSSSTSVFLTELNLEDIFALGAARVVLLLALLRPR